MLPEKIGPKIVKNSTIIIMIKVKVTPAHAYKVKFFLPLK